MKNSTILSKMSTITTKAVIYSVLILSLSLIIFPVIAMADDGSAVNISCNIDGADISIDGQFCGAVSPVDSYSIATGDHSIKVSLPGYTEYLANVTVEPGQTADVSAVLVPELYPSGTTVQTITVTTATDLNDENDGYISLREAVATAMADSSDAWYVINFAADITNIYLSNLNINSRGRLTINGGGGVTVEGQINVITSDVRIVGMIFDGSQDSHKQGYLSMRTPDENQDKYDVANVYVLGCTFSHTFEVGVATCGAYGYSANGYGEPGTTNFTNLVFAGNTFDQTKLFSFAGAGDEDYNIIDGYTIAGNSFTDCGIGMLAGDAHTWYVYGQYSINGSSDGLGASIGYCESNILRNVLISGNTITMTENAEYDFENIIYISCANLGNGGNLTEKVEVRNNRSRITGGDKNTFSTVAINNVSVHDTGGVNYNAPTLEQTSDNTIQDIYIHDNCFELGSGGTFQLCNVITGEGYQQGSNNEMSNIRVEDNTVISNCGVVIANFRDNFKSGLCTNNNLTNVVFSGNSLEKTAFSYQQTGILVTECNISAYGQIPPEDYPQYSGSMSDITVSNNMINNYDYGIVAAGAAGDYAQEMSLSKVAITNNTINTGAFVNYMVQDFGIIIAGSALQTNSHDDGNGNRIYPFSNQNCHIDDVKVTDNTINAKGGILVSGTMISTTCLLPTAGNYVDNIDVSANIVTRRTAAVGETDANLPGIIIGDAIDLWGSLENDFATTFTAAALAGCKAYNVKVSNNQISGFSFSTLLGNGYMSEILSDNAWQWWDSQIYEPDHPGSYLAHYTNNYTNIGRLYYTLTANNIRKQAVITAVSNNNVTVNWDSDCPFTCIVALYAENGKMLAIASKSYAAPDNIISMSFDFAQSTLADAHLIKVFMLDSCYCPLANADTYK